MQIPLPLPRLPIINTEFSFHSSRFNCTKPQPYFINECCYGDDVCRWLAKELEARGFKTNDDPGQEDFGWYFSVDVSGEWHCVVIGFQPNDEAVGDCWIGSVERNVGFLKSILGQRNKGIRQELLDAIDAVLRATPDVANVEWSERRK